MSPLPPSGDVIVTNDGVITPYVREQTSPGVESVHVSLNADSHITYIDVYGFEEVNELNFEYPPTAPIQQIQRLDNGVVRVIGSEPWVPAPVELTFEFFNQETGSCDFYVTFE